MRATEFIDETQKLDEVLPLVAMAGRAVAAGAARAVGRGIKSLVGGGAEPEADDAGPNAKVGTQTNTPTAPVAPTAPASAGTTGQTAPPTFSKTPGGKTSQTPPMQLRPGSDIELPSENGTVNKFRVTKVTGDDVEIENPDKTRNPQEPSRMIFKKRDLEQGMRTK